MHIVKTIRWSILLHLPTHQINFLQALTVNHPCLKKQPDHRRLNFTILCIQFAVISRTCPGGFRSSGSNNNNNNNTAGWLVRMVTVAAQQSATARSVISLSSAPILRYYDNGGEHREIAWAITLKRTRPSNAPFFPIFHT